MGQLWTRLNSDPSVRYRQRIMTGLYAFGLDLGQIQDGQSSVVSDLWIYHTFPAAITDVVYWFEPTIVNPYGGDFAPRSDHAEILLDGAANIGMAIEEDPDASPAFSAPIRPLSGFLDKRLNARVLPAGCMRVTFPQPESLPSLPVAGSIGEAGNAVLGDAAHIKLQIDVGPRGEHLLGRRMLALRFAFTWAGYLS